MLCVYLWLCVEGFFFFKQKTAYEVRISDWSSDVCSSDLYGFAFPRGGDNFGGRQFDRTCYAEFAEQGVYIAVRNNTAEQRAAIGCHEATDFRIVAEKVPDGE